MRVTDEQVAALRALLALDSPEAERLTGRLIDNEDLDGYGGLAYAAFVIATRRRFSPAWSLPELIRFVAAVRVDLAQDDVDIDPHAAEVALRRALDERLAAEPSQEAMARAQFFLLQEMVLEARLDDVELDEFLKSAREAADGVISENPDRPPPTRKPVSVWSPITGASPTDGTRAGNRTSE
jgi:hypothetical protein